MDTLGISLGAFTDEMRRQQADDREKERLGLSKDRATRDAEQFEWRRQEQMRQQSAANEFERLRADYTAFEQAMQNLESPDSHAVLNRLGKPYGYDFSVVNGKIINVGRDPKTGERMLSPVDTQQLRQMAWDELASRAAMLSPGTAANYAQQQYSRGRDAVSDQRWERTFEQQNNQFDRRFNQADQHFNVNAGLASRRLDQADQHFNVNAGLQRERIGIERDRAAAYNRAATRDEVQITPEEEAALIDLQTRFTQSTDPAERARLAQDFQLLQNTIAIKNRRFNSLGGLTKSQNDMADPVVEVERMTPDGGTMKMKVPLSQADPVAFADLQARRGDSRLMGIPPKAAGGGLAQQRPAVQGEDIGYPTSAFREVLAAASQGGVHQARQLAFWITSGDLTAQQRMQAEQVLGIR